MKTDQETIKRVAVGMSGGVDSSLAAALLVEQGYEVTGVFLECFRAPGCRVDEDRRDAMDMALKLGIPFEVLDFKEAYKSKVVNYFYAEYAAGRTPNPDVMCNKEIKFGMFYEWAMKEGFDAVATGHYARIKQQATSNGQQEYRLLRGIDEGKDQSYFLYQLREEQLAHILFPLGEMMKNEVREEARKRGFYVADKPDSQGICFVGEVKVEEFLKDLGMKEKPGKVFMKAKSKEQEAKIDNILVEIGEHRGAGFYTVGQRHGFSIQKGTIKDKSEIFKFDAENVPPLYVVEKDVEANRLVVGEREELYRDVFEVEDVHWVDEDLGFPASWRAGKTQDLRDVRVRIRNLGELIKVQEVRKVQEVLGVKLEKSVFGVAPGQAVVFYWKDEVWGGGVVLE